MGRHIKLKEAALGCGIALSLAQISGAAAFTPEPVQTPSVNSQSAPQAQIGQPGVKVDAPPAVDLSDPLGQPGKSNGTEVTIPGIGSVGSIPKLDFGLELLYGPKAGQDNAAQQQQGGLQLDQRGQENDVQIKGTFSHKF